MYQGVYGELGEWKVGRRQFNNFLFLRISISACVKGIVRINTITVIHWFGFGKAFKEDEAFLKENRVLHYCKNRGAKIRSGTWKRKSKLCSELEQSF